MDAHFPEVTCWEVEGVPFGIPVDERSLDISLVGWDLLQLFDLRVSHWKGRIELRFEHGA